MSCVKYSDGRTYMGNCIDRVFSGKGILTYADGRKYEGEFKNGFFDGPGTLTFSDGKKYVGEYKRGVPNGKGALTVPGAYIYEGEFENDFFKNGVFTFPDRRQYLYRGGMKHSERGILLQMKLLEYTI